MGKIRYLILFISLLATISFADNTATRDLPDTYIPGTSFNVTISITINPNTPVTGIILTESLPSGWSITSADPYWSKYIADSNSYKWLYFFSNPVSGSFTINYTVKVPQDASGSYPFSGTLKDGYSTDGYPITGDTTINQHAQVSSPVFSPPQQTFYNFFPDIEISCSTSGATIYYTTDGSDPDQNSTIYTSPIHITSDTTIKAKAFKEGFSPSLIASGIFDIEIQKADINRNSDIDIFDVILCLRMAINLDITVDGTQYQFPYNDWLVFIANINNNEIIDIFDVISILRIVIGRD